MLNSKTVDWKFYSGVLFIAFWSIFDLLLISFSQTGFQVWYFISHVVLFLLFVSTWSYIYHYHLESGYFSQKFKILYIILVFSFVLGEYLVFLFPLFDPIPDRNFLGEGLVRAISAIVAPFLVIGGISALVENELKIRKKLGGMSSWRFRQINKIFKKFDNLVAVNFCLVFPLGFIGIFGFLVLFVNILKITFIFSIDILLIFDLLIILLIVYLISSTFYFGKRLKKQVEEHKDQLNKNKKSLF